MIEPLSLIGPLSGNRFNMMILPLSFPVCQLFTSVGPTVSTDRAWSFWGPLAVAPFDQEQNTVASRLSTRTGSCTMLELGV